MKLEFKLNKQNNCVLVVNPYGIICTMTREAKETHIPGYAPLDNYRAVAAGKGQYAELIRTINAIPPGSYHSVCTAITNAFTNYSYSLVGG